MNRKRHEGFTLIELLIVIAIIGLLATLAIVSLTSAQQRARDTKRVADMKAIQTALELHWNENAAYPALSGTTNTWAELSTALADFMSAMPVDPDHGDGTAYTYLMNVTNNNQYYVGADLENTNHQSLNQDVDGTVGGTTDWASLTSLDTFTASTSSASLNCADTNGIYCLSGDATED